MTDETREKFLQILNHVESLNTVTDDDMEKVQKEFDASFEAAGKSLDKKSDFVKKVQKQFNRNFIIEIFFSIVSAFFIVFSIFKLCLHGFDQNIVLFFGVGVILFLLSKFPHIKNEKLEKELEKYQQETSALVDQEMIIGMKAILYTKVKSKCTFENAYTDVYTVLQELFKEDPELRKKFTKKTKKLGIDFNKYLK